jgi:hypothetical protein
MQIILALLLTTAGPETQVAAPLPNAHKIAQALSEVDLYLAFYLGEPIKKPSRSSKLKYTLVRNAVCQPVALPRPSSDDMADRLAENPFGPGQMIAAAECEYEKILITPYFDKSIEYKGPRQREPYRMSLSEQKRVSRKTWTIEKRIFHLRERSICHMMSRIPPSGLDCGEAWYFPEPKDNAVPPKSL